MKGKKARGNPKLYNGLDNQMSNLCKYVVIYEKCIKRQILKERDFCNKYSDAFAVFKKFRSQIANGNRANLDATATKKEYSLVFTKSDGCQVLDFLRHLRNAICHAHLQLSEDGKVLKITDKFRGLDTCKGNLPEHKVFEFLGKIIGVYEN